MSIVVHVEDTEAEETTSTEIVEGDFTIVATPPCYIGGALYHKDGTVVITIKNFKGKIKDKVN